MNNEIKIKEIVVLARVIYPGESVLEACKKLVALGVLPPEAIQLVESAVKSNLIDWWGNNIPNQFGAASLKPPIDVKLSKSTWYTQNI
jgi:Fe2+ transport system protein FeoA